MSNNAITIGSVNILEGMPSCLGMYHSPLGGVERDQVQSLINDINKEKSSLHVEKFLDFEAISRAAEVAKEAKLVAKQEARAKLAVETGMSPDQLRTLAPMLVYNKAKYGLTTSLVNFFFNTLKGLTNDINTSVEYIKESTEWLANCTPASRKKYSPALANAKTKLYALRGDRMNLISDLFTRWTTTNSRLLATEKLVGFTSNGKCKLTRCRTDLFPSLSLSESVDVAKRLDKAEKSDDEFVPIAGKESCLKDLLSGNLTEGKEISYLNKISLAEMQSDPDLINGVSLTREFEDGVDSSSDYIGGDEYLKSLEEHVAHLKEQLEFDSEDQIVIEELQYSEQELINARAQFTPSKMSVKAEAYLSHLTKDVEKFSICTKVIANGEKGSTSQSLLFSGKSFLGKKWDCNDTVGLSINGNTVNRLSFHNFHRRYVDEAIAAGVTRFVIDNKADRTRPYNVGEREAAGYLLSRKFKEVKPGCFKLSK